MTYCDNDVKTVKRLKAHMSMLPDPRYTCDCDICDNFAKTLESLKAHLRKLPDPD